MNTVAVCTPSPWYCREPFRLLPHTYYRPADEWNCSSWGISWLFLHVWSAMSPGISASISIEADPGPHVQINALYHHVRLTLPMPYRMRAWTQRKLWRKGTRGQS